MAHDILLARLELHPFSRAPEILRYLLYNGKMSTPVVTRFAPSPTGFQHIGGVRTALYAWAWARKNDGTFILRIEDTDKEREVPGSIEHVMELLRWLGLEWDFGPDKPGSFGPCIQSQRLDTYMKAAHELIAKGLAYPDPYSAEEIDAFRKAAETEKRPFLFRDHRPAQFDTWDGTRPLRFKVPEIKRYKWHDEVRGDLEAGEEALDDFILMKSDGYPTYNFAHIIDDMHMGVTHIMRADEFISSTPKFLSLYEGLGIVPPKFVTLPPILREDKTKKLGKRDGAKDALEYRTEGYLPDAFINALAMIGWNPGGDQEIFSRDELIATFDISGIQTHGGVFNEEKLRWFNREYLLHMTTDEFSAYTMPTLKEALIERGITDMDATIAQKLLPVIHERISTSNDLRAMVGEGEFDYYFKKPILDVTKIPFKGGSPTDTVKHLQHVKETFVKSSEDQFKDPENIKSLIWDYATEVGRGGVLWPLRYALTGAERSPDPFTVISIIGLAETLARIDAAGDLLEASGVST